MIKNWLKRYHWRYPRSLVYLLQASEYDVRDYLAWYMRTRDFVRVERRGKLDHTPKAVLLLIIGWIFVLFSFVFCIFILRADSYLKYIVFLLGVIFLPILLAYFMIIPVLIIKIILQRPFEYFIVKSAKQKLKSINAFKIGIAGSFGKTTMREILKTVLSESKKAVSPSHNHNTTLSISRFVQTLRGDEDVVIIELGEYYPGDIRKLCDLVRPDMGIITGINEAHLKKFKTLERTVKTVYELRDFLGEKTTYVNGESELILKNLRQGSIIYNREFLGGWKIENQKTDLSGTSFTMRRNGIKLELKSDLLGLHQIGPLAAAVDISLNLGLTPEQVIVGVSKTRPFEHRLQPKIDNAGVVIIDDSYNGNPDGVRVAIEFLSLLKNRRRIYVTPGLVEMGLKTEEVHKEIGRGLAKANIEKVVLIKNTVTSYIEKGLKEMDFKGEIIWFSDGLKAYAALPYMTVKGDVVLLQNDWPDQFL